MTDPKAAQSASEASHSLPAGRKPEHHHGQLLEMFQQSLAAEGEKAYGRWGMVLFHSINDETAEAQRAAKKIAIKAA